MRARVVVRLSLVSLIVAFAFAWPSPAIADDMTSSPAAPHASPPPKLEDGSTKRATLEMASYTDTDHVTVYSPSIAGSIDNVTQGMSLRGSYLVDVVSAASVDIVSTASRAWHEVRNAGTLETEYKPHDFGVTIGGSVSSEPDYLSYGIGFALAHDFDEKNTTLTAGYGYGHDIAGRGSTPFSVFSRVIEHGTFNLGLTQVVNKSTVASLSADMVLDNGDQSKPYRYIPMFSSSVAANVPLGASIDWVNANRLPGAAARAAPALAPALRDHRPARAPLRRRRPFASRSASTPTRGSSSRRRPTRAGFSISGAASPSGRTPTSTSSRR